jgi:hypothetical protein
MFSGVYFGKKYKMVSIVKELKSTGYITCNVQDVCHKELMGIGNEYANYCILNLCTIFAANFKNYFL